MSVLFPEPPFREANTTTFMPILPRLKPTRGALQSDGIIRHDGGRRKNLWTNWQLSFG